MVMALMLPSLVSAGRLALDQFNSYDKQNLPEGEENVSSLILLVSFKVIPMIYGFKLF